MSEATEYLDAELRDLWGRRRDGNQQALTRLCQIVTVVLMDYRPSELSSLQDEREEYVQGFILQKVLESESLSRCDHVGALRVYYKNYLKDQIRSRKLRARHEVADEHDCDNDSPPSLEEAPAPEPGGPDPIAELVDAGIGLDLVAKSAVTWFAAAEEWVRFYVALSNCPDPADRETLVRLARRKGIKSYAQRAEKLGFNWGDPGNYEGFSDTLIGRWIESLGIKISPENSSLIHGALKILCFEALSWAEQQEAAA